MTPVESRKDFWRQKTRVPELPCGGICVILHLAILVELRLVTDRQTHRHTAIAYTAQSIAPAVTISANTADKCTRIINLCQCGCSLMPGRIYLGPPATNTLISRISDSVPSVYIAAISLLSVIEQYLAKVPLGICIYLLFGWYLYAYYSQIANNYTFLVSKCIIKQVRFSNLRF